MTPYELSECFRQKENLCVSCARICMGDTEKGCSWSAEFIPVKGWEATPVYDTAGEFYTYQVNRCPKFIRGMFRPLFEEEGVIQLLEKALRFAREDYISNRYNDRKACEHFIRRFVPDCDGAMEAIKKEANEHDRKNRMYRIRTSRWIIFNEGTDQEFAECEDCGYEANSNKTYYMASIKQTKRYYPDHCPKCGAITVRRIKAEEL